jgi:hypothetical protein
MWRKTQVFATGGVSLWCGAFADMPSPVRVAKASNYFFWCANSNKIQRTPFFQFTLWRDLGYVWRICRFQRRFSSGRVVSGGLIKLGGVGPSLLTVDLNAGGREHLSSLLMGMERRCCAFRDFISRNALLQFIQQKRAVVTHHCGGSFS